MYFILSIFIKKKIINSLNQQHSHLKLANKGDFQYSFYDKDSMPSTVLERNIWGGTERRLLQWRDGDSVQQKNKTELNLVIKKKEFFKMYGMFLLGSPLMCVVSLQNWHNFGRQVVSILSVKVKTAIFDFFRSGRFKSKRNFYQGLGQWS